ncbi:MAG TPA: hypothetical protein PLU35_03790 [Phycisphaerales bacterium]|nr:hypothetical protein [Phycisphaerales bacterium]
MRTAWTIFSVVVAAHLLALLGVAGWLWGTGRVDAATVERVRQVLRDPPEDRDARKAERSQGVAETSLPTPASSADAIVIRLQQDEAQQQRLERMRNEARTVAAMVARELRMLDQRRAELDAERGAFESMRDRIVALEGDEQFRKALSVLAGLKPADAKTALMELIGGGVGAATPINGWGDGRSQAVAYLDAMPSRTRSKVMAEFVADDPALAADLLERLRTHGIIAQASGGAGP